MEQENVYTEVQALLLQKNTELYQNARTILETVRAGIERLQGAQYAESPTALFAALVSMLEGRVKKIAQGVQHIESLLLLLNVLITRVSAAVARRFIMRIQELLLSVLEEQHPKNIEQLDKAEEEIAKDNSGTVQKYAIAVLAECLQLQSEQEAQTEQSKLVCRMISERVVIAAAPVVVRQAAKSLKVLLKTTLSAQFRSRLALAIRQSVSEALQGRDRRRALAGAQFLAQVVNEFPAEMLADLVYELMRRLALAGGADDDETLLQTHLYLVLECIMSARPVSVDVSETLLKHFLETQPPFYAEKKLVFAYAQCLVQTLFHVHTFARRVAHSYLPAVLGVLQELLLVDSQGLSAQTEHQVSQPSGTTNLSVPAFAENSIELVLLTCVKTLAIALSGGGSSSNNKSAVTEDVLVEELTLEGAGESIQYQQGQGQKNSQPSILSRITAIVRHLLSSRFQSVYRHALHLTGCFFECFAACTTQQSGLPGIELIRQHLDELLCELVRRRREFAREQRAWDACMVKVITCLGLAHILTLFPLQLNAEVLASALEEDFEDRSNLWVLSVLILHVPAQPLRDFAQHFASAIVALEAATHAGEAAATTITPAKRVVLDQALVQIWHCLPKFNLLDQQSSHFEELLAQLIATVQLCAGSTPQVSQYVLLKVQALMTAAAQCAKTKNLGQQYGASVQRAISALAKLIPNDFALKGELCQRALATIKALAPLAPREYLDNAYLRNAEKLTATGLSSDKKRLGEAVKNLDILVAVVQAVDMRDAGKWHVSLRLARNILCKESDVHGLHKKTYSLLTHLLDKVHPSFLPQALELLRDAGEQQNTEPASRARRLGFLLALFEVIQLREKTVGEVMEFAQPFLPEITVALRDKSVKGRRLAASLLKLIATRLHELGCLREFTSLLTAGLAADSSLVKADALAAMTALLRTFHQAFAADSGATNARTFARELAQLALLVLKENNKEVCRAVLHFLKVYAKIIDKNNCGNDLNDIFKAIFAQEKDVRDTVRAPLKHLISKLAKKFGREVVENALPDEHKKLVRAIVKRDNARKNKAKLPPVASTTFPAKKKKLKSQQTDRHVDDDENDDGDEYNGYANQNTAQRTTSYDRTLSAMEEEGGERSNGINSNPTQSSENMLLKYDAEKQQFHFVENSGVKRAREALKVHPTAVEFENGKLIVREVFEHTGKKRRREREHEDRLENLMLRGKEDDDEDEEDNGSAVDEENAEQTLAQNKKAKARRAQKAPDTVHKIKESGQTFRRNDGVTQQHVGDIKMKGRPDPYAFIQLNPKALNKRFRSRSTRAFDIVLGNQKQSGAFKGLKTKKVKAE